jgi:transposase
LKYYKDQNLKEKTFLNEVGKIEINVPIKSFKTFEDKKQFKIKVIELKNYNKEWFANIVYEIETIETIKEIDSFAAIDLGLNNLASLVDSNGNGILFDGKQLKARNQWFNKIKSKIQNMSNRHFRK